MYTVYIQMNRCEAMDIIISNAGGQPIYEQICRQIKGAIASGRLKPGEQIGRAHV